MRVRISVGQQPYTGYINIDPASRIEPDKVSEYQILPLDFRNIDSVITKAECHELIADLVLDYVRIVDVPNFVANLASKLRHGGRLTISGTEVFEVNRLLVNGEITIEEYNKIVYGDGDHPWSAKSGMSSVWNISEIMKSIGLKIKSIKVDKCYFYITGERT